MKSSNFAAVLTKVIGNVLDFAINISGKKSNISNQTAETVNVHFFVYKSMGTISCPSNQSSYLTGTKKKIFIPPPIDAICVI